MLQNKENLEFLRPVLDMMIFIQTIKSENSTWGTKRNQNDMINDVNQESFVLNFQSP